METREAQEEPKLGEFMRGIRIGVILAVMVLAASAQTVPSQSNGAAPSNPAPAVAAPQAQGNVSILEPKAGAKLRQNYVHVSYALTNPAASASGTPNFQLRLDSGDVTTTTSTEHTFSGLTPGPHTVTVQLVDANGTPIAGGQCVVQFTIVQQTSMKKNLRVMPAALRLDESAQAQDDNDDSEELPAAGGALPLLSVIGFGVLLGGIASAMKTRG